MDNYHQVLQQMEAFGVQFRDKDLPLTVPTPKKKTCGQGGKHWYWLQLFHPDAGGAYVVGRFGSYKTGESLKVEVDWKPLGEAERERLRAERAAAQALADQKRREEAELAALNAVELWRRAAVKGASPYLVRKGVVGEACRYLPDGTLLVPLLRYDLPRHEALRAVQRIKPDGAKLFTKGFAKPGCAVRLGDVEPEGCVILICEGYATGLTLRMAVEQQLPVFVALDAGNLQHVVQLVRELHPKSRILICADDDWRTRDPQTGQLNNPGRTAAMRVAKTTVGCDVLWPVFAAATRGDKDTDFNDLHCRQGLDAVRRQLGAVLQALIRRNHG